MEVDAKVIMHLRPLFRRCTLHSWIASCCPAGVCRTKTASLNRFFPRKFVTSAVSTTSMGDVLHLSDEVKLALIGQEPVVALESTIITHGMPYPDNIQTAQEVEAIVRQYGSVPATIAIIQGKIHIGLSETELKLLGSEAKAVKSSRRDLAYVLAQGLTGGTTVSATMIAAHLAGIPIFVTGGIGGVHRDFQHTSDVSADLRELGRTPVTVVSAGVKSILDIPRTLEYLETEGVGVFTYGPTRDFPAFFTPTSGCFSPYNIETPAQAAHVIATGQRLGLQSGNLIAVPVPGDAASDPEDIELAIGTATREANSQGIKGKEVTPYVLSRVNKLMEGASLKTNIALIKNNAMVGSQIAVALSGHHRGHSQRSYSTCGPTRDRDHHGKHCSSQIVVVGGINIDFTASFGVAHVLPNGDTYRGSIKQSLGGVGRNIADGLTRLGHNPVFLSAVGGDSYANLIKMECAHMDLTHVKVCAGDNSATYCAILDHQGSLVNGIGDFNIHQQVNRSYLSGYVDVIQHAPLVLFDGNIPPDSMDYLTEICHKRNIPTFFEPTTVSHVKKLFATEAWRRVTYTSPNVLELRMMHAGVTSGDFTPINEASSVEGSESDTLDEVLELCKPLIDHIPCILTTIGRHGALLVMNTQQMQQVIGSTLNEYRTVRGRQATGSRHLQLQPSSTNHHAPSNIIVDDQMSAVHIPIVPTSCEDIISVSGAGDCLVAAFVSSLLQKDDIVRCLSRGIIAANLSLHSHQAVPTTLNNQNLEL